MSDNLNNAAADAVCQSERLYRTLYEASPLMYFVLDDDGIVLSVNQNGIERLGYNRDELIGSSVFKVFYDEDRPRVREQIEILRQAPHETGQWEFRKIHKNGNIVHVSENVRLLRQADGKSIFLVICEDVTERKRTEVALRESRIRYQSVIENAPVIFFALDRNGIFTLSEGAGLKKMNRVPGEIDGKSVFQLFRRFPKFLDDVRRALSGENFTVNAEVGELSLEVCFHTLHAADGEIDGIIGVSVDVTERERAERASRESEQRYRRFIEQSGEGIWCFEFDGGVPVNLAADEQVELFYDGGYLAECNDVMARMYGLERAEDLIGTRLEEFHVRTDAANLAFLQEFVNSGYRIIETESHERDADGEDKYFLNNFVGTIENGRLMRAWGTQRDVTKQKRAEQKSAAAFEQLKTFAGREALVNRISNSVRQSLKVEEVFSSIVNELGAHLKVSRCILYLFDHDKNIARAVAGFAGDAPELAANEFHVPLPLTMTTVEALLNGDFVTFDDVASEPTIRQLYENALRERGVKSLMCVAIRVGEEITGVISFTTTEALRHWSQTDVALACAVANQAGIAIRQAELYQRAEAVSLREQLVNRLGMQIRASLQLPEVLHAATHELGKALDASRVYLRFYDERDSAKSVSADYEFVAAHPSTPAPPAATYAGVVGQNLLREQKTMVISDTEKPDSLESSIGEYIRAGVQRRGVKSAVYCPLVIQNRFRGTLCIEQTNRLRKWTEDEIKLSEGIAVQLSIGIAQAELFELTRRAKREWETTFDAMSDGIFIFNRERRLIRVNNAGAAFEQAAPRDLLGKTCCEMLTSEKHTNDCVVEKVIAENRRIAVERTSRATGRPLFITAEPLVDDAGKIVGAVGTVRDLHELRQAESIARKQELLLAQILEGVLEPIFAVGTTGKLLWCNKATTEIYGGTAENIKQRHFLNMVHPDDYKPAKQILENALAGKPQFYESKILTETDETRHVVFNSIPLTDDEKTTGALWFARDVTEQKQALERALQADKLRALGQLASGVAHDFNNSLTAILGRVQLLRERTEDRTVRHSLQVVQTAAEDAAATVRRIQTFARQSPTNDFETVEVSALLRDSVEIMRTRWENEARKNGIIYAVEFNATCEFHARANASELREVFVNLIGNALDAMPKGGKLEIECSKVDGKVILTVADTGAGMTEEIRERIFEPFFSTKGANGTGLGLSVSYSIVEAHGGHISAASEVGRGTTFTIELPIAAKNEISQPEIAAAVSAMPAKLSILVVDDEDFVRDALAEMLRELNHDVTEAESGADALAKLDLQIFDAVFTDLTMPEMDGWQLARAIRGKTENMKIVMVTGYGRGVQPEAAEDRQLIDAIIGKPFNFRHLSETLEQLKIKN